MIRLLSLLVLVSQLYGCIGNPVKDRENDTVSLVVAMFDMDAIKSRCNTGRLRNLNDDSDSELLWYMYRANNENHCILYSYEVEPGVYSIERVSAFAMYGASSSVATKFMLPDQGKPYGIHKIKRQGVYFLGSFKFVEDKTGRMSVVKTKGPREKQVLSEMLNHRLMHDGEWKKIIQKRIKRLK